MVPLKKWRWISICIVLSLVGLITRQVFALGISTSVIQFNGVILNGQDQVTFGSTDAWRVDASDADQGWNVMVSATDFTNENSQLLSASNLEICLPDENIVIISGAGGPISTQPFFASLGGDPVKIVSADDHQGTGVYDLTPEFKLLVPAQTFKGAYTSTITVSVVSGP
jgi:hypothetical protein